MKIDAEARRYQGQMATEMTGVGVSSCALSRQYLTVGL